MDNSTLKILVATLAITAGVGVAEAQDRGMRGEGMTFEALDADGSGEITLEDLEALKEQRFAQFDADGDGSVTAEEFRAHAQARAAERADEMFARLDADGDGVLSRDVLESRMGRQPGERMLSRFDTDNSGGVSAEEFEAAKQQMAERRGKFRDGKGREEGRGWGRGNN
ncbi:EF-hand domain-containing protein [Silicimonas sp. MF1-12-2]|uniref:EF-hand domain-containing protein n=1 Tax=Silicimonas sp. MF1-12-2 TaxID=3384793 RepID=UPI0039B434E6